MYLYKLLSRDIPAPKYGVHSAVLVGRNLLSRIGLDWYDMQHGRSIIAIVDSFISLAS